MHLLRLYREKGEFTIQGKRKMKYEALHDVNKNSLRTSQIQLMLTGNFSILMFLICQNNDTPCIFFYTLSQDIIDAHFA